jgi:hypothetical protein
LVTAEKAHTTHINRAAQAGTTFFRKAAGEGMFQSTSKTFFGAAVQPKLEVSSPGDAMETEADSVASKVVSAPATAQPVISSKADESIDRKEEEQEESIQTTSEAQPILQRMEDREEEAISASPLQLQRVAQDTGNNLSEEDSTIQRKAQSIYASDVRQRNLRGPPSVSPRFYQLINNTKGQGSALPVSAKHFMEQRFGVDFGEVRIHTGREAVQLAADIRAQAFTHGKDIFFNENKFSPHTAGGDFLLAHELTHVVQQNPQLLNTKSPVAPVNPDAAITPAPPPSRAPTSLPEQNRPAQQGTSINTLPINQNTTPENQRDPGKSVMPARGKPVGREVSPEVPKEIPRSPKSPRQDPAFKKAAGAVRVETARQKKHDLPEVKKNETVEASAIAKDEQEMQDAKEKTTREMGAVAEAQTNAGKKFSAEEFKADLLKRIDSTKPQTESDAKAFAQKPPVQNFEMEFSGKVAGEQKKVTDPLDQKASASPVGGVAEKEVKGVPDPKYPGAPRPVNPKLAIPKQRTDEEISAQSESDRVDGAMAENQLTDDQLKESREPTFIETYEVKEQAKQKAAEAPGQYRAREQAVLESAEAGSQKELQTELQKMNRFHRKGGGEVFTGQTNKETETEKRQRFIKGEIDTIYRDTVGLVKGTLEAMSKQVKEDFAKSLKDQTDKFNANVRSRISDYYGDWRIDDKLFGPADVVVKEDGTTRPMTLRESMGIDSVKSINPDVYAIFWGEKNAFLFAMNLKLDIIAANVEAGLMKAHNHIRDGETKIANFKKTLKGDELRYATEIEKEVTMKFQSLEASIDDTREDLLQTMAEQYKENVDQLEKSFNEINDELKKSWIDRAIEFVKTVGKTIFQLADLLLSILVRIAYLVWDIIQHPIRFFETLVDGLKDGIGKFVGNIGTYMKEAFWTWITGATPGVTLRLSETSGTQGLFDLVLQVVRLTPPDLMKIVEKILGREVVAMIDSGIAKGEKLLEPVIILMKEGPVALWAHIKESLSETLDSTFERIRESVFFAFIEKGLKWIAGFFIPGGGFVKIVKAIVKAFQFVADNIDNIRSFFDSIFDSMEAAVQGNAAGVASKIISGLKMAVVLALDFLAKQLGLEKIVNNVQKIIQSLRRPVVNAIEWILMKAKPVVVKLMNGVKKGADWVMAKADKGKAWVKDKAKKGKDWAKEKAGQAKDSVLGWLGFKKRFTTENGQSHTVYVKSSGARNALFIQSTPMETSTFLTIKKTEVENNATMNPSEKRTKLGKISHGLNLLDGLNALMNNDATTNNPRIPQMILEVIAIVREIEGGATNPIPPLNAEFGQPFVNGVRATSFSARFVHGGGDYVDRNGNTVRVGANHAPGTEPGDNTLPDSFQVLRDLRLNNRWVRFHILNENIAGIGVDSNLIPTPTYINNEYRKQFEDPIKGYYESHLPIWLQASINYRPEFRGMFVNQYAARGGAMKYANDKWEADPSKNHTFNRTIELPQSNTFNINYLIANPAEIEILVNITTVTKAMMDILVANVPPGGYRYFRQMERVLAIVVLNNPQALSLDDDKVDASTLTSRQKVHAKNIRTWLGSVDWTY